MNKILVVGSGIGISCGIGSLLAYLVNSPVLPLLPMFAFIGVVMMHGSSRTEKVTAEDDKAKFSTGWEEQS